MAIMMMVLGINLILIKKVEYEGAFNRFKGAEYNLSLAQLMRLTAKHRGLLARVLSGDLSAKEGSLKIENELDSSYQKFLELNEEEGKHFHVYELSKETYNDWKHLKEVNLNLTPKESYIAHVKLIKKNVECE